MLSVIKNKKASLVLLAIVGMFIILHACGIGIPYHQDEYKWVLYSHPEIIPPGSVPHPPLTEFLYTRLGPLVGDMNFRLIPSFFGFLNLLLVSYLAKLLFDKKTAVWAAFLFTISFYSLLASLMVDVDGAVMPFFFLIMLIGYFKLKAIERWKKESAIKWLWVGTVVFGALGGFLVKVSFFLAIAAMALDVAMEQNIFSDRRRFVRYLLAVLGGLVLLVLVLLGVKLIFPFFNLGKAIVYWEHFAVFANRGWFQIFIQWSKAILYTSPLLIIPALLSGRDVWKKARVLFLFIFIATFFYLFAFDFSLGALDRYFQFLVMPLVIISGAVYAALLNVGEGKIKKGVMLGVVTFTALLFFIQFIKHAVPPLYPKTEWVGRLISLKWNFLFPFVGGSGPLPFYVSFAFIACAWVVTIALLCFALYKTTFKKTALFSILIIGLLYNAVFMEEYLFGKINGSARMLVKDGVAFIAHNPDITTVAVYNDNGGFDIRSIGKYSRRIYATPQFESSYQDFFKSFQGHVLFVDIPHLDPATSYARYFATCKDIHNAQSGSITSIVYDCRNAITQ